MLNWFTWERVSLILRSLYFFSVAAIFTDITRITGQYLGYPEPNTWVVAGGIIVFLGLLPLAIEIIERRLIKRKRRATRLS